MLDYSITARPAADGRGTARCDRAALALLHLEIAREGRADAFNPAELLLTAFAACMLKSLARVTPMLGFSLEGAEVRVHGVRQDAPPRMISLDYELIVDTEEPDSRLALLHRNVQKYGTVYNTLFGAVQLAGTIRRRVIRESGDEQLLNGALVPSAP